MIRVLLFGAAADRAGIRETELDVQDGTTVAEIWPLLSRRHPDLEPMRDTQAVNGEYARGEDAVAPGDEVAVLPPVSGG